MHKVIFVDFDGTITKTDTCNAMVEAFAKGAWKEIARLWEEKKLTTVECANRLFELFDAELDDVGRLMDTIEIDEYFKEFLSLCRSSGYKVYILSDGYDYNIRRILGRYDIELPFYSNTLLYDGGFKIQAPHHNIDCGNCGTCKSNLMARLRENGDEAVYIGDGYSDTCAAVKADIIFAKGSLYKFCTENKVPSIHFESFKDIIESGRVFMERI